MKTRVLGATVAIAALSGLLVPSPAQARDGVSTPRPLKRSGAASVRTTVDFVSRTKVIFRNFTVRDICPNDFYVVKAQIRWTHTDETEGKSACDNGCGSHGTNFGNLVRSGSKPIAKVRLYVCIYKLSGYGGQDCGWSVSRYNQFVDSTR